MNNLDKIFNPKSVAIIGASEKENSVGNGLIKNITQGGVFKNKYCKPFKGKIYPINPNHENMMGLKCYKSILDIKNEVDLAIIAVPAKFVTGVMNDCAKKKVSGVIVISAGFSEIGEEGKKLQDEFMEVAKKAKIPVIGPNCLGIIRTPSDLNASFAPSMPPRGNIGFISQSGALADSIIDWSIEERYGMSTIISYGNAADIDASDLLEWLGEDKSTDAITIYIEGLKNPLKFMEVAKKVTKKKPVIVIKGGRTEEGQKAISSHTGSLAGSYEIYEAMFKQSGVIVADTVEELFDTAKALANQPAPEENSVVIVTNGGGAGVLTADYCRSLGVNLAELKASTIKNLDNTKKMHPAYSKRNPLDIIGDALPERYEAAIGTVLSEDYIHGVIVLQTLQTMTDPIKDAEIIIDLHKRYPKKPVICVYMGGKYSDAGAKLLEENGIPDYNDPKKAVKAMKSLIDRSVYLKR